MTHTDFKPPKDILYVLKLLKKDGSIWYFWNPSYLGLSRDETALPAIVVRLSDNVVVEEYQGLKVALAEVVAKNVTHSNWYPD